MHDYSVGTEVIELPAIEISCSIHNNLLCYPIFHHEILYLFKDLSGVRMFHVEEEGVSTDLISDTQIVLPQILKHVGMYYLHQI